jgi:voltage-gated potassium channel
MSPQSRLERYEQRTEWPLAAVALAFLALYSVRVLARLQDGAAHAIDVILVAVYFVFVLDYLARLALAQPRGRWFLRHLWELPIILLPFLRPLRLLSLAVVVKTLEHAIGHTIRGRVVMYTITGAATIVYAASLAILEAERGEPESQIKTFGDALWWAMATVTTVGYGDLSPVTTTGRFVAATLMIGGITLLGVVTATMASWIVQRVSEEDAASDAVTAAEINALRDEIRRLTESVDERHEDRVDPADRVEGSG